MFNLSLNQSNKSRAIKAGIIPTLLHLLEGKNLGVIDEALSILLPLVSHLEGRTEAGRLSFIVTLVEIMKDGTLKDKECATSVLRELGLNNSSFILAALQKGAHDTCVCPFWDSVVYSELSSSSYLLKLWYISDVSGFIKNSKYPPNIFKCPSPSPLKMLPPNRRSTESDTAVESRRKQSLLLSSH